MAGDVLPSEPGPLAAPLEWLELGRDKRELVLIELQHLVDVVDRHHALQEGSIHLGQPLAECETSAL